MSRARTHVIVRYVTIVDGMESVIVIELSSDGQVDYVERQFHSEKNLVLFLFQCRVPDSAPFEMQQTVHYVKECKQI